MFYYERRLKKKGFEVIIGVDEAGRGPLAGPVVAAAVTLDTFRFRNRIDDSKKLTPLSRQKAFLEITKRCLYAVAAENEKTIDRLNILVAARLAMQKAVTLLIEKLGRQRKIHIIVDGNMDLKLAFPCLDIIKGDTKSKTIAAASILAKVTRDRIMESYDKIYPQYGFIKHKGYPTSLHRLALEKFGLSAIHRRSFCRV